MAVTLPLWRRMPKLVIVVAFDPDEQGDLKPVFGPAEIASEGRAISIAQSLAQKHAGVIAWSREVNPAIEEYGEPTILFQHGSVPDME